MSRRLIFPLLVLLVLGLSPQPAQVQGQTVDWFYQYLPMITKMFGEPVLKWKYGGCYSSWCETGWYSSPAVLDINGDGKNEVIASAYSIWALDGETGKTIWQKGSTNYRTWPGIAIADVNRDGKKDIVTAQSGGIVTVYNQNGSTQWQKQPAGGSGEFRGLLVDDLNADQYPEIVVTRAYGSAQNTWVLDHSGNTMPGWPQLSTANNKTNGYAWGVYNANAAAADIDGDGKKELIVPSDVHYINAYKANGSLIRANATDYPNKYWGQVGVWENLATEKRGWGECDGVRAESYRANFADGPAVITDVDGDGKREIIVTGNMYDCDAGYPPSRYMALYIFNADRSRFNHSGFNWTSIPVNTGAPLKEDYNVIESAESNPVVVDLDGDGKKEILYASYDGRMHAFWLDKTEHMNWPYQVTKPGEGIIRFASEPVVADLDNNGSAEVIFTSWTQKGSQRNGKLHILSAWGEPIYEVSLPAALSGPGDENGALGAPTLANIDNDPDLEVIVNTINAGVVAYDLPGTADARLLWETGRGNFNRSGAK